MRRSQSAGVQSVQLFSLPFFVFCFFKDATCDVKIPTFKAGQIRRISQHPLIILFFLCQSDVIIRFYLTFTSLTKKISHLFG